MPAATKGEGIRSIFLTDLDQKDSVQQIANEWFNIACLALLPEKFIFRIAVHEIESWIIADINGIANFLNIDRTYLYTVFKNKAGISPMSYLNNVRLEKAKWMIEYSDFSNTDIAIASGFYDYSHFSHAFKKKFGLTPGEFRKQIKLPITC